MQLPKAIATACAPLFEALPLERAMSRLTGSEPKQTELVKAILQSPALLARPDLAAGLWLYVDNLEQSHSVSQSLTDTTGSYWHGIMHRREGDFANSRYWMRKAGRHTALQSHPDLDPDALIDAVAAAVGDDEALVAKQREEWQALFEWCAQQSV